MAIITEYIVNILEISVLQQNVYIFTITQVETVSKCIYVEHSMLSESLPVEIIPINK